MEQEDLEEEEYKEALQEEQEQKDLEEAAVKDKTDKPIRPVETDL
jgi:hypothetical protein